MGHAETHDTTYKETTLGIVDITYTYIAYIYTPASVCIIMRKLYKCYPAMSFLSLW